ncbi:hypothetical protein [Streptomyces sp. 1222.5]|uniref:hypothetical protein n=1 Tax=Streptomyces sp. 1222.5 TaxID=1881026 RepID=UPI003EB6A8BF
MSRLVKRPRVNHHEVAARLRSHPRMWLPVGEYRSSQTADNMARRIRKGYALGESEYGTPYEPAGAYEARLELTEDGTRILARYIGTSRPEDSSEQH